MCKLKSKLVTKFKRSALTNVLVKMTLKSQRKQVLRRSQQCDLLASYLGDVRILKLLIKFIKTLKKGTTNSRFEELNFFDK